MLCLTALPQVDAETVVGLAQDLEPLKGQKEESLDEALLRTIALSSSGSLSPMAAILGGVAAQEVLKVDTSGEREGLGNWVGWHMCQRAPIPSSSPEHFTNPDAAFRGDPDGNRNWELAGVLRVKCPPVGNLQEVHAAGPVAVLRCPRVSSGRRGAPSQS